MSGAVPGEVNFVGRAARVFVGRPIVHVDCVAGVGTKGMGNVVMRWMPLVLGVIAAAGLAGCGETPKDLPTVPIHPVKGTVTLDGKPIGGARVSLQLLQGAKPGDINPNAVTDETGAFQLSTYAPLDGAPEGAYAVMVSWPVVINAAGSDPEYGKERLPARYQVPEKSGLVLTVSEDLQDAVMLELSSK